MRRAGSSGNNGFEYGISAPVSEFQKGIKELFDGISLDVGSFMRPLSRCDLSKCGGMCCHDGVYLRAVEKEFLQRVIEERSTELTDLGLDSSAEMIAEGTFRGKVGPKTAASPTRRWASIEQYPDHFPRTACVFLQQDHSCALQIMAKEEGLHPWAWKPLTCWLHPMALVPVGNRRCLTLPSKDDDPQAADDYPGFASFTLCGQCSVSDSKPAYEVLREELDYLKSITGRDFYGELRSFA